MASNIPKDEEIVLPLATTKLILQVRMIKEIVIKFIFAAILNPLLIVRMFGMHTTTTVIAPNVRRYVSRSMC